MTKAVKALKITPKVHEQVDSRPCWSVSGKIYTVRLIAGANYSPLSVITDLFWGTGNTPEERNRNFLEGLSYHESLDFPVEGTNVKASFFSDNPYYTTILVKAGPIWDATAKKCGSFLSELGQLRFFPRSKKNQKKVGSCLRLDNYKP